MAACTIIANSAELRISGPYVHENLSLYLVHGADRVQKRYLTLSEALEQHKAVVYETCSVNQPQVENLSGEDLYIQSGEIVKGGKQDRVLQDDVILPAASGKVNVTSFCVEQGRWTRRGSESAQAFAAAPTAIASPEMKRAVKATARQADVWAEVSAAQGRLAATLGAPVKSAISQSSYQLTMEAPKVRQTADAFKEELSDLAAKHRDSLGFVMAVNGKVTGAELYATHELFGKLWPKLLESAAVEAMASPKPAHPIAAPAMADVRQAATGNGAKVSEEKQINRRTNSVKAALPQGLVFETRDADASAGPVHRSYVVK